MSCTELGAYKIKYCYQNAFIYVSASVREHKNIDMQDFSLLWDQQ